MLYLIWLRYLKHGWLNHVFTLVYRLLSYQQYDFCILDFGVETHISRLILKPIQNIFYTLISMR